MPTRTKLEEFIEIAVVQNLNANVIYEDTIAWIRNTLNPEDVFSTDQLDKWAESEGYVKQTENQN